MKRKHAIVLKKFLAVLLTMVLGLCWVGCQKCDHRDADDNGKCDTCGVDYTDGDEHMLNGKKIIFIGNSYTYYGQTVLEKTQKELTQDIRSNDTGYFYQLCQDNGAEVEVTNWTFGGHSFEHLFGGDCAANRGCNSEDHASYLTDKKFDYVVMQAGSGFACDEAFIEDVEKIMNFFKEVNADTKFVLLVQYSCYGTIGSNLYLMKNELNNLKILAEQGVTIVDWGGLVMNILDGKVQVPNSAVEYTKNTFVIAKSEKDGYHPNLLSGYITTLMTYCAITGESAQGKTYDFCNDSSLKPVDATSAKFFSFEGFISTYYKIATTNFPDVFASKADMQGLQGLIDEHLAAKAYMNYNYED